MAFQNELPPNTAARHQGRMAYLDDRFLPRTVLGPLWEQAQESSLVMRLGQRVPVSYGETVMPVSAVEPEVGQVGTGTSFAEREGHVKPVTGVAWGHTSFAPIKLAGIITVSEEFSNIDPQGLNSTLQTKLANAIGRGVDLAVFHGRRPDTGGELLGIEQNGFVAKTTKKIELADKDPRVPAGSPLRQQLIDGWELVANERLNMNAWAVDPLFRPKLVAAMDPQGRALFGGEVDLAAQRSSLLGLPAEYGRAVSGQVGTYAGDRCRIFGGDWSRCLFGFADAVRIKKSTEGVVTVGDQTVNLWQTNQVALLIEVTFGWLVDPRAFVKFELPAPATAADSEDSTTTSSSRSRRSTAA
ncbi:phage major capsid protein [Pseudonocardiaceae bacterium YIM PH 21723]|nr:phage major capsid protein [Pseudonocardiaceae bacterium YIM PH 21723]